MAVFIAPRVVSCARRAGPALHDKSVVCSPPLPQPRTRICYGDKDGDDDGEEVAADDDRVDDDDADDDDDYDDNDGLCQ